VNAKRRVGRRPLLIPAFALGLLLGGCTFERRADTESGDLPAATGDSEASVRDASSEDSVLGVVTAFHRALSSGDAARVAQLVGPDALLVDQEEGVLWSAQSAGPLPSSLEGDGLETRATPAGLTWEAVGHRVDAVGPARLVILRYRARVAGEDVDWWGMESLLLLPGPDGGWRIHYMHRSRGSGGPGASR
jgi:ketosteroid isomerase-like protein